MVGVMFLDLDNFKLVNDTFGHICGDMLLKSVADRLTGILREADTVCRLGGDEFTLMLPHIHAPSDVATIARKVIQELRVPFQIHGQEVCVTASIGIALYPNDGMDVEGLLKHADLAMYRAKDRGRDQCQFYCDVLNPAA
jgi:diguanylate cyclase (GGDEF)-like protein